jgi:hypothetical protein
MEGGVKSEAGSEPEPADLTAVQLADVGAEARARLDAAGSATEAAWDDVRAGFEQSYDELKASFDQARQALSDKIEP